MHSNAPLDWEVRVGKSGGGPPRVTPSSLTDFNVTPLDNGNGHGEQTADGKTQCTR